jgi:hypothetical protein
MTLSSEWLFEELEDPFLVFPIQSVGRSIAASLAEADANLTSALRDLPVARKYWSVEAEHYFDEIGLLVGAAFVLGQVFVAQSVSIVEQLLRTDVCPTGFPQRKEDWMRHGSPIQMVSGLSEVEIIVTSANYFKHYCEWPRDWDSLTCSLPGSAVKTIKNAKLIGMAPGCRTDNLLLSLRALGLSISDAAVVADKIQSWREALAADIRGQFYERPMP